LKGNFIWTNFTRLKKSGKKSLISGEMFLVATTLSAIMGKPEAIERGTQVVLADK
jgi:hypothetical protein